MMLLLYWLDIESNKLILPRNFTKIHPSMVLRAKLFLINIVTNYHESEVVMDLKPGPSLSAERVKTKTELHPTTK